MKKRNTAVFAALLILTLLAGCGNASVDSVMSLIAPEETPIPGSDLVFEGETTPEPAEPLRLTCAELSGVFCPFWAEKDGDRDTVELTQLALLAREGKTAPAKITTEENEDGSTTVRIQLERGLTTAEGTPITTKDLLFTYYVLLDADYDGPIQTNTVPVRGLSDYWNGMDMDMYMKYMTVYAETFNNGKYDEDLQLALEAAEKDARDRTIREDAIPYEPAVREAQKALDEYDQDKADEIRAAIEEAWRRDAQAMVDYTMANYSGSISMRTDYTAEEIAAEPGLQVMYTMLDRGFGAPGERGGFISGEKSWDLEETFPTTEDLYEVTYSIYNGDIEQYWKIEGVGRPDILETMRSELVRRWAPEDENWRGEVEDIGGIVRKSDYALEITVEFCDDTILRNLTDIYLVPLSVYGDMDLYRPEEGSFGFTRGDLSEVRACAGLAIGGGEYTLREATDRLVTLDPNPCYWQGESEAPWAEITRK